MLLLLHILFAFVLSQPSLPVVAVLGLSFALRLVELGWLQSRRDPLSERAAKLDGAVSILTLFLLAGLLAWLTNRDHSPYQVLLAIPVLQSACLFALPVTVLTIVAADGTIFLWLRHYFSLHPQPSGGEYLEAGMLAIVLAIVGVLMWILARLLRAHQTALSSALIDLQNARESLVREEKLAAVGRLASGIAHEIRNPVAMIASAITTAADTATDSKEREEMFAIAGRQAKRLEILTTEFLTYARPSVPRRSLILVADLLSAIASGTRIRAADRHIEVICRTAPEATVNVDASQVEGALMNLTLNAVEATGEKSAITVTAGVEGNVLNIEVENSGSSIPDSNLARIFEPFFTSKQAGTGLGLAIARGVARAHGGDLWVSRNENGRVAFTMTLAAQVANGNEQGATRG
jgi:signal transduction histidine kinase